MRFLAKCKKERRNKVRGVVLEPKTKLCKILGT